MKAADIQWEMAPASWPDDADPIERIVDLTIERDSYRLLTQQLIHALHDVTCDRNRLRRLRDEEREAARRV